MAAVVSVVNSNAADLDPIVSVAGVEYLKEGIVPRAAAGQDELVAAQRVATHVDDAAFVPATDGVVVMAAQADETASDSVDEGDAGALRMTLNRRLITAGQFLDDAAYTPATDYSTVIGAMADDTATDSVNEGDSGAVRMTLDRRLLVASQDLVDDAAGATGRVFPVAVVRDDALAALTPVDGDFTYGRVDAQGALWVRTQPTVRVSQTPTVSTTPAYTAKDAVGGLLTFANAARVTGGSGVLMGVTVIDASQQRPALELVLFDRTFTASTDNAIFAPSDADLANCIGVVAINSWADFSTNSVASVAGVSLPIVLSGTSLFGQLVTRGTPTFVATTDITVLVTILQD